MRLQGIVCREVAATESAVVTIGVLQAGTKENVIPDEAIIKMNVRTFDAGLREWVLTAINRIVKAEAVASGALRPPEITPLDRRARGRRDSRVFPSRSCRKYRAGSSQRGFRVFRNLVERAFRLLVRRGDRT